MPSNLNLDYYYGTEAEQYSFYRVPKTLLTDSRYKGGSIEAKVLYGLLLDRMSLSVRNGWMDKDRRVYIYFTQEDAMALMSCGKDKATRLFRELDQGGIGLIERKKQGQGRPTKLYVKRFTTRTAPPKPAPPPPEPFMPGSDVDFLDVQTVKCTLCQGQNKKWTPQSLDKHRQWQKAGWIDGICHGIKESGIVSCFKEKAPSSWGALRIIGVEGLLGSSRG